MRPQPTPAAGEWPSDATARRGILVLAGYGLDVRVWRGRLRIEDGIGAKRRRFLVHRATGGLKRLVVLGHTGSITLDAVRWLNDVGASYLQIDGDGKLLASFGGDAYEQPRLRRAQALAAGSPEAVGIRRGLIARKLAAQSETLDALGRHIAYPGDASEAVAGALASLSKVEEAADIRRLESGGAIGYWSAWRELPVRFAERDREQVPPHWLTFGTRASALTGQPRSATNPANAMLNYLYAIVEGEATIAARAVGLDPGIGILHVDTRYRSSLAADLMEPIRPLVDRFLIETVAIRTFGARDFFETRAGVCRVTPPLTTELAATILHWRPLVGKVAEDVAHALLDPPSWEPLPRPITRPHRRNVPMQRSRGPDGRTALRSITRRCAECGEPVAERSARTCSAECLSQMLVRGGHERAAAGQERLRELRSAGLDATKTPEALAKRRASMAKRRAEQRAWDAAHPERADPDEFRHEILPALAAVSIRRICEATGLSTAQSWRIRSGRIVPHQRWWEALRALISAHDGRNTGMIVLS